MVTSAAIPEEVSKCHTSHYFEDICCFTDSEKGLELGRPSESATKACQRSIIVISFAGGT